MSMLRVGATAPDFSATATNGEKFVLSEQRTKITVVYFFPKAFTPGCTKETKTFSANHTELVLSGAQVVGVSTDDGETQCRFADSVGTPFPLIADEDRSISKAFDVLWPLLGFAKRVTYVLANDRTVLGVFRHELRIGAHTDEVLRFVNAYYNKHRSKF